MNFRMSFHRYVSPRLLNHSHVNDFTYKIYPDPIFISHTHLNSVTQHHINRKTKITEDISKPTGKYLLSAYFISSTSIHEALTMHIQKS